MISVSVSVCLSVCKHISGTARPIFTICTLRMAVLGPSLATILCIPGFIDDVNTMAGKVSTHVSDAKRVSLDKDLTSRRIPKLTYHLQPARATKLATDRSIFIRVLDKKNFI